jgi:quercetin dioxygenase-like cupin family protein
VLLLKQEVEMFCKKDSSGYRQALEGIKLKTLVFGEKTLFTEFRLQQGSTLPGHEHPHEQTGYLVSGRMLLSIGEETFEAEPGDSWCIPGNVEHGAEILEDSIAIEVFSPVRRDYLPSLCCT